MQTNHPVTLRHTRAALVCIAFACAGAGAQAESRQALVLEDGERLESLQVLSVIRDAGLSAQSPQGSLLTDFLAGGVLGVGMSQINEAFQRSMLEKRIDGAIDSSAVFDFRTTFSTGIDSLVAASTWPATRTLRILDKVPLIPERQELAAESMADATLQLETRWFLSVDLRTVVIATEATLFDQTGKVESDFVRYRADFAYASDPLLGRDPKTLLEAWAADGGARLRRATREGVQETLVLLADDVFGRHCGALQGENSGEEFEGPDPRTGGGSGWRGTTMTQSDTRIRLRRKDGHLFSVPAEYRKPVPVFRQEDFHFKISYRPDNRPCVQVDHPSGNARVWLDPVVALAENDGLTDARVDLVLRASQKRVADLRAAWDQVHGARRRDAATPDSR